MTKGTEHYAIDELTRTSDNISKLSTAHIDEVLEVSTEKSPYYSIQDAVANHGWLDSNGWLHRTATVANTKNGKLYEVTIDIAKAKDGRLIYYSDSGNIKQVGQAKLSSMHSQGLAATSQLTSNTKSQSNSSVNPQSANFEARTELADENPAASGNIVSDMVERHGWSLAGVEPIYNEKTQEEVTKRYKGIVDIVFNPADIKSAMDNIGLFDKENPKYNYSLTAPTGLTRAQRQQMYKWRNEGIEHLHAISCVSEFFRAHASARPATAKVNGGCCKRNGPGSSYIR